MKSGLNKDLMAASSNDSSKATDELTTCGSLGNTASGVSHQTHATENVPSSRTGLVVGHKLHRSA